MDQLTKEQAIAFHDYNAWEAMSYEEIAKFQICQKLLCVPFSVFHEAVEKTIGRPVFTHEFCLNADGIKNEIFGDAEKPSLDDIISILPKEKRMLVII